MTAGRISILVPVYQPEPDQLAEAIESVREQVDPNWELVLVADGPQPAAVNAILQRAEDEDERVVLCRRAEQGGIVAASNDGLAAASGEFVAFLDNDDTLAPYAIKRCRDVIEPDVDVVYTDEDKLDPAGNRVDPFFKPAWSPERLLSQMYIGHLAVYRRSLVNEIGGLRDAFNGSQDHDLALRATRHARKITHIPEILYHWRMASTSVAFDPAAKDWAFEAGVRAVQDHLDAVGLPAVARRDLARTGVIAIDPALVDTPRVSIIVPTGGTGRLVQGREAVLVENAIESVVSRSTYPAYEIVVVLDRHAPDSLGERLEAIGNGRVSIVRDTNPFSYARANNIGVSHSRGEVLVFLNDDTEVISPDWVERMVMWTRDPDIGAVGCRLEYADGRIQHAGVICRDGGPGHRFVGYHKDDAGPMQFLGVASNASATTGACLAVTREKFEAVGGFSLEFPLNFNDVDLCLKLGHRGWRTVVDLRTRMYHFETSTRSSHVESWEHLLLLDRWSHVLSHDPWDNPNVRTFGQFEEAPSMPLIRLREQVREPAEPRTRRA